MALVGINYEHSLAPFIEDAKRKKLINAVEFIPDNYAYASLDLLERVVSSIGLPYVFHFIGNSIGSADFEHRNDLRQFRALFERFTPMLFSDHLTCCRSGGVDLRQNISLPRTEEMVELVAGNLASLKKTLKTAVPFVLENVAYGAVGASDELTPLRFLQEVAAQGDCGFLLDVHNLVADEVNFRFDAAEIVTSLPAERIREVHIAGGSWSKGKKTYFDSHSSKTPKRAFELLELVMRRSDPELIVLERIYDPEAGTRQLDEIADDLAEINRINNRWTSRRKRESRERSAHFSTTFSSPSASVGSRRSNGR